MACEGRYDSWRQRSLSCLAYIILLDQFSRNIYRNTPKAFDQDPLALQACLEGQKRKFETELSPVQRWFFYMPMMHSENLEIQKLSVAVFHKLAEEAPPELKEALESAFDFARRHYEIIARFGRFPHRNLILNRHSSREEIDFLKQPGSTF